MRRRLVAVVVMLVIVFLWWGVIHRGRDRGPPWTDTDWTETDDFQTARGGDEPRRSGQRRERVRTGEPSDGGSGGDVAPRPGESGGTDAGASAAVGTGNGAGGAVGGEDGEDGEGADEASVGGSGRGADSDDDVPPRQRVLRTRVVDAATGDPVSGVRLLVAYVTDGGDSWYGGTTGKDGGEMHRLPEDFGGEEGRFEMRVGRRGYEYKIVPLELPELGESQDVDVTLTALDHLPNPGRLVVFATRPDGTPITGIVLVGGSDGLDGIWQWGIADSSGTATLEGVPAGHWTLRLEESRHRIETILPDDGETRVHLVGPELEWPGVLSRPGYELLRDQIQAEWRDADDAGPSIYALQRLNTRWRAVADRREVIVMGLPAKVPAWLRAQPSGPQNFWRVRIKDGEAHFPGLTLEDWSFRIERPGEQTAWQKFAIEEGDGPQRISLVHSE